MMRRNPSLTCLQIPKCKDVTSFFVLLFSLRAKRVKIHFMNHHHPFVKRNKHGEELVISQFLLNWVPSTSSVRTKKTFPFLVDNLNQNRNWKRNRNTTSQEIKGWNGQHFATSKYQAAIQPTVIIVVQWSSTTTSCSLSPL